MSSIRVEAARRSGNVVVVSNRRRLLWVLLGAVAFGVLIAVVKGQEDDVRNVIGNMSAPWVVLPFLAGMAFRRPLRGALVGVLATEVAFLAFYVAEAVILDLGPHPWYVDLKLTVGTVYIYETLGLVSGAVYGALGALFAKRRTTRLTATVGAAFVAEPLIVWVMWKGSIWGGPGILDYPALWIGEVVLGLCLIALPYDLARRRRPWVCGH